MTSMQIYSPSFLALLCISSMTSPLLIYNYRQAIFCFGFVNILTSLLQCCAEIFVSDPTAPNCLRTRDVQRVESVFICVALNRKVDSPIRVSPPTLIYFGQSRELVAENCYLVLQQRGGHMLFYLFKITVNLNL